TSWKPRPSSSYEAASPARRSSTCWGERSTSCARIDASIGWSATKITASSARRASSPMGDRSSWPAEDAASVSAGSSAGPAPSGMSAIVGIDQGEVAQGVAVTGDPADPDVAERLRLVQVDESLLEQLEHGQEVH